MKITINNSIKHQQFEGFGASGAWWAQEVGGWENIDEATNLAVRDRIAQLLYSKTDGIGLNTYRYNIGGGSKDSNNCSIPRETRRAESFDTPNGLDFSKDANAVYMMKKAVEYGADEVILFVNSPIERLTKNHKAHGNKTSQFTDNLSPKNYKAFADYCLDVTEHFVKEGLPIKYLSPINEPIWKWVDGQEGCHYSPRSAGRCMDTFAKELKKRDVLKDVKLSGVESGDIRWFNKSYTRELLKHLDVRDVIDSVDIHSYFLPAPIPFINNRIPFLKRFRKWMNINYPNMPIKMSEWTHMKPGRDYGMDSALEMARVMIEDLTILEATSWQHWVAVSEVIYNDGLIYIDIDAKTFDIPKRYYATGNFSKYIPHNATRIEASCSDKETGIVAFEKDGATTLIVVNFSDRDKGAYIPLITKETPWIVTNNNSSLEEKTVSTAKITLSPKSINTFII